MSSYITPHTVDKKSEVKKMEITINVNDLDISQLTSDVMLLSNDIGTHLMNVFKDAYHKGLKSGYVLGHKEGFDKGKDEGFQVGKQDGYKKGRFEGKQEYAKYMSEIDDDETYNYVTPITQPMVFKNNSQSHSHSQNHSQSQSLTWGT